MTEHTKPTFTIEAVDDGDCEVLQVYGEIDHASADEFARQLLHRRKPDSLIIDIRRVGFVDAGAVAALTRACRTWRARGTDVQVVQPPLGRGPRRVLDILALDRAVDVHDDYFEAAEAADC